MQYWFRRKKTLFYISELCVFHRKKFPKVTSKTLWKRHLVHPLKCLPESHWNTAEDKSRVPLLWGFWRGANPIKLFTPSDIHSTQDVKPFLVAKAFYIYSQHLNAGHSNSGCIQNSRQNVLWYSNGHRHSITRQIFTIQ